MPFELGLAVEHAMSRRAKHEWFVFEPLSNRLKKSLSDLDGTDPFVDEGDPDGVITELANALSRTRERPVLSELRTIFNGLRKKVEK